MIHDERQRLTPSGRQQGQAHTIGATTHRHGDAPPRGPRPQPGHQCIELSRRQSGVGGIGFRVWYGRDIVGGQRSVPPGRHLHCARLRRLAAA